jgi:hypothetical protein
MSSREQSDRKAFWIHMLNPLCVIMLSAPQRRAPHVTSNTVHKEIRKQNSGTKTHKYLHPPPFPWCYVILIRPELLTVNFCCIRLILTKAVGIAQSVLGLATGWTVQGSNSGGVKALGRTQTGLKAQTTSYLIPIASLSRCNSYLSKKTRESSHPYQVEARFFAPVQTVPGAHPPSYTKGTGSFPGVKRPGGLKWPPTPI